ncbi:MAG: heme lyase CcmF/NrfE family subunit [Acidobacteriia bacterium]|nr:heme lyase CcmF/NrfE family subunit [Terriglobia bacterium]
MPEIGNFAVILVFVFSAYAVLGGVLGAKLDNRKLVRSSERAVIVSFVMVTLAVIVLWTLLLTNSFNVAYVAAHSNRDLPFFYKFSALWAGQEGSLLFWGWLLSIYSFVCVLQNRNRHRAMMPYVIAVLMTTQFFFSILNLFVANPFSTLAVAGASGGMQPYAPPDGNGLNPLLQYPMMVIHPVMLYLGYVGFIVPFAFAIAAMVTKQLGDTWIKTTRRWTMVAWFFQGCGILLGAAWAYHVLGWGGYWGWDPVENASLMPWLMGTAFLHSVMIQEKKGMLKVWNMVLIILTFFLCIFGTFLTRSGVVSSVHAFAQSSIGTYFVTFLALILAFSLTLLFDRLKYLKSENQLDSVVSRESSFLFNNLILLAACFAVFWGTMFPVISEAVKGVKITVGAPYFNKINLPIGLFLLFLTGVGPLFAWRNTSLKSLKKNFIIPSVMALGLGAVLFALGVHDFYALMAFILCLFVTVTIVAEFYKGARARGRSSGEDFVTALINLTHRNTRRYGGYVIHFGIVLIFMGVAGAAFNKQVKADMAVGERTQIGSYTLQCDAIRDADNPNYASQHAVLSVFHNGVKQKYTLRPEQRFYKASGQPTTEVALHSTLVEDLYVVFSGTVNSDKAIIQAFVNPLVLWIWIGGLVVVFGTVVAMVPSKGEMERRAAWETEWEKIITTREAELVETTKENPRA